jgi:hypothetical protein
MPHLASLYMRKSAMYVFMYMSAVAARRAGIRRAFWVLAAAVPVVCAGSRAASHERRPSQLWLPRCAGRLQRLADVPRRFK